MLEFNKLDYTQKQKVVRACAFLFSPEDACNIEFLHNIQVADVKTAFRRKARMYHPDLHRSAPPDVLELRRERFIKIRDSYETLVDVLPDEKKPIVWDVQKRKPKLVAVGGAKGGIGKSVFTTNLGVTLAGEGGKTIIADLDLGGANTHLYLGVTRLSKTLNDFLGNRFEKLDEIIVSTDYGPDIIGGDSSALGAANIHFSKKMKLIQALHQLDADYVIADLGGDTSYNMLDFYNAAELHFVMTTCEPASYLDAYNFIKVSLLRKLMRDNPVGAEEGHRDSRYVNIIKSFIGEKKGTINDLLKLMSTEYPEGVRRVKRILNRYRPVLIINKTESSDDVSGVSERIRSVAGKMLSIEVETVMPLPFDKNIEMSTRELFPVMSKYPDSQTGEWFKQFVKKYVI